MVKYKKIYLKEFNYCIQDFIPSELTGKKAVDIHHIIGRGKQGQDRIENLMALTREEHIMYGDRKDKMVMLLKRHQEILEQRGITFDKEYFNDKITQYGG